MRNDLICQNCGTPLDEDPSTFLKERNPCPNCGSKSKHYILHAKQGKYILTGSDVEFIIKKATATLILQTVLEFGETTNEGKLIQEVTSPWFEIIKFIKQNPTAIYEISDRKWEEIIAGAYKKAGFDEVILTPRSGDYGRDVIAIKRGLGTIRVIDQVKAYKPGHLVTANDVRALVGVLQTDGASKGFLTTTSDFAPKLLSDPLITPLIPSRLELINGDALIKRLIELECKQDGL